MTVAATSDALAMSEPAPGHGATLRRHCPVCGGGDLMRSVAFDELPVLCNDLLPDRESARRAARGRFVLTYCRRCAHLFNAAFEEARVGYTQSYENSLHFSPRFVEFDTELALRLGRTYRLAGRLVVDVGCGKGDFLKRICLKTGARGIGFDKSFERDRAEAVDGVEFVGQWFEPSSRPEIRPALVTCRHVLEHVAEPSSFLAGLGAHPGIGSETIFYVEVPNALYTLRDMGIWDLIYEHVSYFTSNSLRAVMRDAGFEILNEGECFGGQYLFVEARPAATRPGGAARETDGIEPMVRAFDGAYRRKVGKWRAFLGEHDGTQTVVWGAGSKGVTFVNVVPEAADVAALVDVNPHKQGRFVPCIGIPVLAPEAIRKQPVRSIIVMNPLYREEVATAARTLGLAADIRVA